MRLHAIGNSALPSGVVDDWDASNYVSSPRPTIRNSSTLGTTDSNLLTGSRRVFNSILWKKGTQTTTDNNATAPDGSNEATTVVASSGVDWGLRLDAATFTFALPAGTYTMAVSVRNAGGGSADFRMSVSTAMATKTATGSWQRFTDTFVHAGGSISLYALRAKADVSTAANFEVCDAELFSGSSDLNPAPLSAKPRAVQNRDLILGVNAFDSGISVSGGEWAPGCPGLIPLAAAETPSAWTVAYVVKPSAANFTSVRVMLGTLGTNWKKWAFSFSHAGLNFNDYDGGAGGQYLNDTQLDKPGTTGPEAPGNGSLPQIGFGYCVVLQSYDGANSQWWLNGIKICENSIVATPQTFTDLSVGGAWRSASYFGGGTDPANGFFESGFTRKRVVRWNRMLSNSEALQASSVLLNGLTYGRRLLASMGDSLLRRTYTDQATYNTTKKWCGINTHQDASAIANHDTTPKSTFMDDMLSGLMTWDEYVLVMMIGTNNIWNSQNNVSAAVTAYTDYIDHRRAAASAKGRTIKIVSVTLLPRGAIADGKKSQFDIDRAAFNAALVGGMGGRINALVRIDQDATYGPDAASDNLTLFPDNTHPVVAAFQPVFYPLLTAAINSV